MLQTHPFPRFISDDGNPNREVMFLVFHSLLRRNVMLCFQDVLNAYSLVFDAVYTPRVTRLLKEAEEAGATVVSGLEMFIRQAMKQFALFTGHPRKFLVSCQYLKGEKLATMPILIKSCFSYKKFGQLLSS
jgi:hypothetical protein